MRTGKRQQRVTLWLWTGFALLVATGASLLAILGWSATQGEWRHAVSAAAPLLLMLWRTEAWLDAWSYRLNRRANRERGSLLP